MDLGDFLPADIPGGSPGRSTEEQVASAVGCGLLPLLDFMLVLLAGVWRDGTLAVLLPVGFAALAALLCRRLEVRTGAAILTTFGCLVFCFVATGVAFLFAGIGSFYSTF